METTSKKMVWVSTLIITNEVRRIVFDEFMVTHFLISPVKYQKLLRLEKDDMDAKRRVKEIWGYIKQVASEGDYVTIVGDFNIVYDVAELCSQHGIIPVYPIIKSYYDSKLRKTLKEITNFNIHKAFFKSGKDVDNLLKKDTENK